MQTSINRMTHSVNVFTEMFGRVLRYFGNGSIQNIAYVQNLPGSKWVKLISVIVHVLDCLFTF